MVKNKLFYYRRERGLRQFELAERLGISEVRISRIETGRTSPTSALADVGATTVLIENRQGGPARSWPPGGGWWDRQARAGPQPSPAEPLLPNRRGANFC